jgi:hypothetical protein
VRIEVAVRDAAQIPPVLLLEEMAPSSPMVVALGVGRICQLRVAVGAVDEGLTVLEAKPIVGSLLALSRRAEVDQLALAGDELQRVRAVVAVVPLSVARVLERGHIDWAIRPKHVAHVYVGVRLRRRLGATCGLGAGDRRREDESDENDACDHGGLAIAQNLHYSHSPGLCPAPMAEQVQQMS